MGPIRAYVFPAVRILIWSVIALSLVWLAFFRADPSVTDEAAQPSADITPPVYAVARGDVLNTVSLSGQVSADPAVEVKITQAGEISKLLVSPGATVAVGTPLAEVRYERETAAPPASNDPAAPAPPPAAPSYRFVTVTSTAAGTVTTVSPLVKQVVAVGDVLAKVSPGTLSVSAPLTQADQLRLLTPPTAASISVQGGPAPFPCAGLTIGIPPDAEAPEQPPVDPYGLPPDPGSTQTGAVAKCAVPSGTTVFVGMAASIDVEAGAATGVLVVPVTAVEGSVANGNVWLVESEEAEPVVTPVVLGLTDGFMVEVVEGLSEGDQILEFIPNSEPQPGGPMGAEPGYGG